MEAVYSIFYSYDHIKLLIEHALDQEGASNSKKDYQVDH